MKALFFILVFSNLQLSQASELKNVIFIVADGMGLASVAATRIYAKGSKGQLNIEKFKTIGLVKTYSSNDFTTDSAAGATAYACGVKSYNGSIAMSSNEKSPRPLRTIVDVLKRKNKSVGIVTTTTVYHATPAAFYAHAKKRDQKDYIASQVPTANIDFLLGGGTKRFVKLQKKLKENNWQYITDKADLKKADQNKKILGVFNEDHLPYQTQDQENSPSLKELTQWGLTRLKKNKKGYFFLIEAGRIDHAAHANKAKEHVLEVMELEKTLEYLLSVVDLNNTLIVLTADHETGGLAVNGYGSVDKVKGEKFIKGVSLKGATPFITWATGKGDQKSAHTQYMASHTAIDVPIYSIGKGHEKFGGFMLNSEVPIKILNLMNTKF